jgi:hypothetical protein
MFIPKDMDDAYDKLYKCRGMLNHIDVELSYVLEAMEVEDE